MLPPSHEVRSDSLSLLLGRLRHSLFLSAALAVLKNSL